MVTAIIGILAAVAIPLFLDNRENANQVPENTVRENTVRENVTTNKSHSELSENSWGVEYWHIEPIGFFRTIESGIFKLCIENQGVLLIDDNNRLAMTTFEWDKCKSSSTQEIKIDDYGANDYMKLDY